MPSLSKPSRELAERIVSEVVFADRLIGYRMKIGKGFMEIPLYSFEEVVGLLNAPVPWIEPAALEQWVREKMGDDELADLIRDQAEASGSLPLKLAAIRDLMAWRLLQCRKMTGNAQGGKD